MVAALWEGGCSSEKTHSEFESSDSSDVTAVDQVKSEAIEQSETVQEFTSASEADDDALASLSSNSITNFKYF